MIQLYSDNISVPANSTVPLNNAKLRKGCTAVQAGAAGIQLNRKGIYCVHMDAYAVPEAAGLLQLQLTRNGVPMPEAISAVTGAAGSTETLGFDTYVQVSEDNTPCCCTSPTELQVMTGDVAFTGLHINVTVSKLC